MTHCQILIGDTRTVLPTLPDQSVHCCVTSPPYFGLRDYGVTGQMGLEPSPAEFVEALVAVMREVKRVLRDDGTLWLNLGDSYAATGGKAQPHRDSSGGIGNKGTRGEQGYHAAGGGFVRPDTARNGLKPKDLIGIPWRVAFALQADGWYLRQDIIWAKPNPMPESVTDRCTKSHEYLFLLSKSARYYYDAAAIKEPGKNPIDDICRIAQQADKNKSAPTGMHNGLRPRPDKQRGHSRRHAGFNDRWDAMERAEQCSGMRNKRSVWTVATQPCKEAHFATFPPKLITPCILAGCPPGGTVLDPFAGTGTTGMVAIEHGRNAILIELNPAYAAMAEARIAKVQPPLFAP